MTATEDSERDTALADLLSRIERSTTDTAPAPEPLTGRLANLHTWWTAVGSGSDPTPILVESPSASDGDCLDALLLGAAAADRAVDSGATLAIPRVVQRDALTALTVTALLTRREASRVVGQPEGMSDGEWMDRCAAIRDRCAIASPHISNHLALLDALGARSIAATAGILLGAAARGTPCLIVGTDEWAAALIADRMNHLARSWWRPATTSPDPAQMAAAERIGLDPLLPLELSDQEGLGADAVVALLLLTESVGD